MVKIARLVFIPVLIILFILFLFWFNTNDQTNRNLSGAVNDIHYEKAKVIMVIDESLTEDDSLEGLYLGTQKLEVEILTGERKGEICTVTNHLSRYFNVLVREGMEIIVNIDSAGAENTKVSVFNYNRTPILYGMALVFFAALWGIGGKKGLLAILGLLITSVCMIFLFVPMVYQGYSPVWAAVLLVILSTCSTLLLLNGWGAKTFSAILGTTIGVLIAGVVANTAGLMAHISGLSSEEAESLLLISSKTGMHVPELLFAGILIASLGAVMDISISVASAIQEVHVADKKLRQINYLCPV